MEFDNVASWVFDGRGNRGEVVEREREREIFQQFLHFLDYVQDDRCENRNGVTCAAAALGGVQWKVLE